MRIASTSLHCRTPIGDERAVWHHARRRTPRMLQLIKVLLSLSTAILPYVEMRWLPVLPVTGRIRETVLPVAVLAAIGAVAAGVATARHTAEGLSVGWFALIVFLGSAVAMYGALDLMPRASAGLYVVFFAAFTLSVSAFLSSHGRRPPGRP
jgi:hypothetical protein